MNPSSPLPWRVQCEYGDPRNWDDETHFDVEPLSLIDRDGMGLLTKQDAAFIVTAANSYHKMREALVEARRGIGGLASTAADLEDSPQSLAGWVLEHLPEINKTIVRLDAALKASEGE